MVFGAAGHDPVVELVLAEQVDGTDEAGRGRGSHVLHSLHTWFSQSQFVCVQHFQLVFLDSQSLLFAMESLYLYASLRQESPGAPPVSPAPLPPSTSSPSSSDCPYRGPSRATPHDPPSQATPQDSPDTGVPLYGLALLVKPARGPSTIALQSISGYSCASFARQSHAQQPHLQVRGHARSFPGRGLLLDDLG